MNEYEKLRTQQIDEQNTRMTKKLFDEIQNQIITYSKAQGLMRWWIGCSESDWN